MGGNFSNQVAVSELELNLHATTGETVGNIIGETYHSPREGWPSWSLPPPPEKDLKEENGKKDNAEGNSKHFITGPVGNSEFCLPCKTLDVP